MNELLGEVVTGLVQSVTVRQSIPTASTTKV